MLVQARWLATLAVLSASALNVTAIELKHWSCGFTPEQKKFTYDLLSGNCSKYKSEVNLCCAMHKDCYRKIRDFETDAIQKCNVKLCLCLEEPSGHRDGCGYKVYENCHNARMYADFNIRLLSSEKTYQLVVPQGMENGEARKLYQQCKHATYTTRACAVNHNSCSLGAKSCEKDFKDCMECIRIVQENRQCSTALDSLAKSRKLPQELPQDKPRPKQMDEEPTIKPKGTTGASDVSDTDDVDIEVSLPDLGGEKALLLIIAVAVGFCLILTLICSAIGKLCNNFTELISSDSKSHKEGSSSLLRQLFVSGGRKPAKKLDKAVSTADEISDYKTQV